MATMGGTTGLGGSLWGGLAGAAAVTALNEAGRRLLDDAPRAELLGERGVDRIARRFGRRARGKARYRLALAGDLASNAAWYALAARSARPLRRGALLGALAGLGAVFLPERLGLGRRPTRRAPETALLAFAWYLAGGLVAGAVLSRRSAARA